MASSAIIRGKGPRDGFPDYLVKKLRRDKLGVLSGLTLRHFPVGDKNQRIDPAWLNVRKAPDPGWSIPCVDADSEIRDAMCVVTYNYEGMEPQEQSDGFANDSLITYELDTSMAEKPIQTHPNFSSLKTTYGWDEDTKTFAEFLPGGAKDGSTGLSGQKKSKNSPLAGVDSWRAVGVIYRISYATHSVPRNLLAAIGVITSAPPNISQFNLPPASQKRKWLTLAPKVSKRGNCSQITLEWELGEPGGLPEAIYSAAQLGENSNGANGANGGEHDWSSFNAAFHGDA